MATKLQSMIELYDQTLSDLPQSGESWAAFLHTAAHNYKYPFQDQVSIFMQRPDATACATFDFWNKRLNRRVNAGGKGIALIDTTGEKPILTYVFDISDTHGKAVWRWEAREQYLSEITESLQNSFGEVEAEDFPSILAQTAANAVEDNYSDYFDEMLMWGSISESEIAEVKPLLAESVKFMLLTRCGIAPEEYVDKAVLSKITAYQSPERLFSSSRSDCRSRSRSRCRR